MAQYLTPSTPGVRLNYKNVQQGLGRMNSQFIVDIDGFKFKAIVSLKYLSAYESKAELHLFIPGKGFELLIAQYGMEINAVRDYFDTPEKERGGLETNGRLAAMLELEAVELAKLGYHIAQGRQ